jgi:hypothetical protein
MGITGQDQVRLISQRSIIAPTSAYFYPFPSVNPTRFTKNSSLWTLPNLSNRLSAPPALITPLPKKKRTKCSCGMTVSDLALRVLSRSSNPTPKTSSRNSSTSSLAHASSKSKCHSTGRTRPSRAWLVGLPFFSRRVLSARVRMWRAGVLVVCGGEGEGVVFAKSQERMWTAVKTGR